MADEVVLPQRVFDLSDRYANFMKNPRSAPGSPRLCGLCRTFVDSDWDRCFRCSQIGQVMPDGLGLDVVVPITYSPALGQMHTALRGYKDPWGGDASRMAQFTVQLAAVLHRFLNTHEPCVAAAAGAVAFDTVTSVPSNTRARDEERGRMRHVLSHISTITSPRYRRVLVPTDSAADKRQYDPDRFAATEPVDGACVLLIDDTWTTGSTAQSAAYALKRAGAVTVGMVVIGRHMSPEWEVAGATTDDLLKRLPAWDWDLCAADSA